MELLHYGVLERARHYLAEVLEQLLLLPKDMATLQTMRQ